LHLEQFDKTNQIDKESLKLLHIPEDTAASSKINDIKSGAHPYFEIMCKLYYELVPEKLYPFVKVVEETYVAPNPNTVVDLTKSRSFYARALGCLPPYSDNKFSVTNNQVIARAQLLFASKKYQAAIDIFLGKDMWNEALNSVMRHTDESITHYELFHILLTHALKSKTPAKCKQVFNIMPKQYTFTELLKCMRITHSQENQTQNIIAIAGQLELALFIPKMLEMK